MPALAAVRFLAELGLLAALGWIGWIAPESVALSVVLALLLPASAAAVWGTWVAPRSTRRLSDPARLAVEVTLFSVAFIGLLGAGPMPATAVCGVILWLAFLVSTPVRRRGF